VLIFDSDVGQSIGQILRSELGWTGPLVCLDGISVGEFDFVDIGNRMEPSGTFPVVVKSLMFPAGTDPSLRA
jgi:ethanolamine utilization protein EutA